MFFERENFVSVLSQIDVRLTEYISSDVIVNRREINIYCLDVTKSHGNDHQVYIVIRRIFENLVNLQILQ